jgi:predicted nuclease of restriction endonuclease-like (RecB) superfamily
MTKRNMCARHFPLPWSDKVRLLSVNNGEAQKSYETEALRLGWSARQLDRRIASQFHEHLSSQQPHFT